MDMQLNDYKRFCDEAPVGLYKTMQSDGTFLYINPYGARLLGFASPEELIGKAKSSQFYSPDLRAKLIDELHKDGKVSDFEIKVTRPDGTIKWITATASNGNDYIIGSLTDITERKEMMRRLQEDSEKCLGGITVKAKARSAAMAQESSSPRLRLG
jgi:PAS domain S-box-containing protein